MTTHHPGRRHRYSYATTTTLLVILVLSSYHLGIDAFQPVTISHGGVAIPIAAPVGFGFGFGVRPGVPPISAAQNRLFPPVRIQRLFARAEAKAESSDNDDDDNDDDEESSNIQEAEIIASSYTRSTDDITDDTEDKKKHNHNKNQLAQAYTVGQYLFLTTAVLHLWTFRPASLFLESEFARSTEWGAAAGYAVAAGICHILKGATRQDRLSSDTYQRLSVGLLGFCLLGLAAVPGEAAFVAVPGPSAVLFTLAVKGYGTALSFVGWKRGVVGGGTFVSGSDNTDDNTYTQNITNNHGVPRIMLQEFATGLLQTVKGLRVQNAKKALTYRNCLLLVVGGMFSNFMEGIFDLRYGKALQRTWLDASLQWSAVARLFLISTMIVSLKDAAERDRLTGTTFIQLNRLTGFWAVAVAAGQTWTTSGVAANRGIEMAGFGALFFIKAWKSVIEKRETSNKGAVSSSLLP